MGHEVKGRAFGSPLARGLYPRASTAEVDPRVKPGAPAAVDISQAGDDASAFEAHLLELLGDKPRAEAMGRAGLARVLERHSLDRMTDALVGLYKR